MLHARVDRFGELCVGLSTIGIAPDVQQWMLRVCAAVLHIGNVTFADDGKDGSAIAPTPGSAIDHVKQAAQLLGLPAERLRERLVSRKVKVGGSVTVVPLRLREADLNRDDIAKGERCRCPLWMPACVTLHGRSAIPQPLFANG
jgi:myosin heavy subunit